jgi:Alw26I/Eco31I/Esp3I family type II restriction endonuclease
LTIFEIYQKLTSSNKTDLFKNYFGISILELENICKSNTYSGNKLSPGVMSNAPDRLDGFHCYNSICGCRSKHDKGRSEDNMKSYVRDRRAYEHFSDGKCLLANLLMGKLNTITSSCFICNKESKMTADHIGPISLGFIHDTNNFQACCQSCNSSKNNRLTEKDVEKLKTIEEKEKVDLLSWWARDAWEKNKHLDSVSLKNNLDKNAKKFLSIIQWLKNNKQTILETFVNTIYMNHDMSYDIRNIVISSTGDITFQYIESISTKKTKNKQNKRTKEILMEFNEKTNRKCTVKLSAEETSYLSDIQIDNFKNMICKVLQGL